MADLPAVIYRTDRGRVVDEEELVYPTKMRTPPQQDYKVPQGTKIPRRFLRNPIVTPTPIGGSSGKRFLLSPENTLRKVYELTVYVTTSATVGVRDLLLEEGTDDNTGPGNFGANLYSYNAAASVQPTATQTAQFALTSLKSGGARAGGTVGVVIFRDAPLLLPDGCNMQIIDSANIDPAGDTFLVRGIVEEFNLPKGVARGEIPMGLESGFQWDLSDVRQVA